ncbi:RagB/SusD family nutrient uptake outer membrane protein [Parapedobacter tibetensis]|uniref:RagB/SusD family nutrient uptake outer membrane protein n=1 Tax=Parapedobacter tibetensis TaxID=2972951 RepID=UPI00214D9284|nr:RagB/SusD family nutrient uptake outer membrane protein [Parapedobacter tibetensis]
MKRKIIVRLALVTAIAGLAAGCSKFLEVEPDLRTQLNNTEKVAELLVSAYPKTDYMFMELASDNVEDKGPRSDYASLGDYGDFLSLTYKWKDYDNPAAVQGSTSLYWSQCYLAIASANSALGYIEEHPGDRSLDPYKGEALVARAYAHFMLVTLYATAYEIGGGNTALGIPYVTEPERVVFEQYDRSTVGETYARIEKDLMEGLSLLDDNVYNVPKFHFTRAAANAFAARFFLFKGAFDKVIEHASAVYRASAEYIPNLRPWNTVYNTASYDHLPILYTQSSQPSNLLLAEANSAWGRNYYIRYGLGQEVVSELTQDPNVTGGRFSYRQLNREPYYSFQKWKELFFETQIGSGFGQPYVMVPLFTVDELLMNRAEAYAQSGQLDLALQDINAFVGTRIANYDPGNHSVTPEKVAAFYEGVELQQGVVNAILDLKRAEFVSEGLRWLDIIRHRLPVRHNMRDAAGNETYIELPANDPRRVFQIPETVTRAGIERNPR